MVHPLSSHPKSNQIRPREGHGDFIDDDKDRDHDDDDGNKSDASTDFNQVNASNREDHDDNDGDDKSVADEYQDSSLRPSRPLSATGTAEHDDDEPMSTSHDSMRCTSGYTCRRQ